MYRSRLSDCLVEVTNYGLDMNTCRHLVACELDRRLQPFAQCRDALQIQQVLSDLIEFVVSQTEG